jgi:hypothetical protein
MDWLGIISVACAILGIPGSLLAFKLLKNEWDGGPQQSAALAAEIRAALARSDEDRVLLKFDQANFAVPNTFENAVQKFVDACPIEEDARRLVYNPIGIARSNDFMLGLKTHQTIMAIVALLVVWLTFAVAFAVAPAVGADGQVKERGWLDLISMMMIIALISFALVTWAYLSRRTAERYRQARDAARAYMEYLRAHDIHIRSEFTQLKQTHDRARAETMTASKSSAGQ